ncbi:MAG TPA: glycosyltransferase family 4 protein [Candidatus Paceibacterota bacterium]|nr:glycosyltransferase family 4 protein [Candidatus Paceibacterota bacterium]
MKILYLITKSGLGGAQVHVLDLTTGMQSLGHTVALMCPMGGWLDKEFTKTNNNFYANNYFDNTINPFKIIKACFAINKAIKDFNPDIIACHSSVAGVLGRFMSIFHKNLKVTFTAHSWAFTDGSSFARKVLMIPIEKFLSIFTDKIICVSSFDKDIALKYKIAKNEKIKVVYNGVSNRELRNLEKKEAFRIITVTRLDYPKLPELLIKAFASIKEPDMELVIVGYGSRKGKVISLIKELNLNDKVQILDSLTKEDVIPQLAISDLFVLISKHEGLPITILEAMSVGLPVVASNVGGIKEEINESCGYLVENNIEKIKEAILKIASNSELHISMSRNTWSRQREIFSTEKFIEETERIYKEIIKI